MDEFGGMRVCVRECVRARVRVRAGFSITSRRRDRRISPDAGSLGGGGERLDDHVPFPTRPFGGNGDREAGLLHNLAH